MGDVDSKIAAGRIRLLAAGQIRRNRVMTVVLIGAALFNAALVAAVGAVGAGTLWGFAVVLGIIVGVIGLTWVFVTQVLPDRLSGELPDEEQLSRLEPIIEGLTLPLDVEPPLIRVRDDEALNAYTTMVRSTATITFTTGLLAELDDAEVRAVAAHEVAHVINRDVPLMALSIILLQWARFVCWVAIGVARMLHHGSRVLWRMEPSMSYTSRSVSSTFRISLVISAALIAFAGNASSAVAQVLSAALGRQREWMADATAAALTGEPALLATALAKLERAETGMTGVWSAVHEGAFVGRPALGVWWDAVLDTHPRTSARIARLTGYATGSPEVKSGLAGPILAGLVVLTLLGAVGAMLAGGLGSRTNTAVDDAALPGPIVSPPVAPPLSPTSTDPAGPASTGPASTGPASTGPASTGPAAPAPIPASSTDTQTPQPTTQPPTQPSTRPTPSAARTTAAPTRAARPAPPPADLSAPVVVEPAPGARRSLTQPLVVRVQPVSGSTGYLYGFFQNGAAVWENYANERVLSGTEYVIAPGSPAAAQLRPGALQIWVRALVGGTWTDAKIVDITVS